MQKAAQMDEEAHIHLHDIVCLWIWVREKISTEFNGETINNFEKMFHDGLLGSVTK